MRGANPMTDFEVITPEEKRELEAEIERLQERERELKIGITYALHEDLLPSECKMILEKALKGENEE